MMANGTGATNQGQGNTALITILQNLVVAVNGITQGIIKRTT
jgi:hypothetical protein